MTAHLRLPSSARTPTAITNARIGVFPVKRDPRVKPDALQRGGFPAPESPAGDGTGHQAGPCYTQSISSGGESLSYDCLLLVTGSQAVLPNIPGITLAGVVILDNLEDALGIAHLCKR